MSELCLSSTSKIQLLFSLLMSDLFLFCSFILSHPIYFLYFLFFSPYLFKLLSFLSPLFITTSLLLLALLTVSAPSFIEDGFSEESFLVTAYHALLEGLRSKIGDNNDRELLCLEDFEVFRIVFHTPMIHDDKGISQVEVLDPAVSLEAPVFSSCSSEALASKLEVGNSGDSGADQLQDKWVVMEEKRLEAFFQELDEFDERVDSTASVEEKKIESPKPNKVVAMKPEEEKSQLKNGSEAATAAAAAAGNRKGENTVEFGSDKGRQTNTRIKAHSQRLFADANVVENEENDLKVESSRALEYINLGSYGSLRREKDWKRTLAGKLFEERHNATSGGEGMDLLWETYETESSKTKPKFVVKEKNKKKHDLVKTKSHLKKEEYDEDYDAVEDETDGQLCCLQALKFSTGKMNMGMGRPSLVRISKAIKGIGWLHHVSSRHSKKVHNGDRF